jgi:hypothetical protein
MKHSQKPSSKLFSKLEQHRISDPSQVRGGNTDPVIDTPGTTRTGDNDYTHYGGPDCGDEGSGVAGDWDPTSASRDVK